MLRDKLNGSSNKQGSQSKAQLRHGKGTFIEGPNVRVGPILWTTHVKSDSIEKKTDAGVIDGRRRRGQ